VFKEVWKSYFHSYEARKFKAVCGLSIEVVVQLWNLLQPIPSHLHNLNYLYWSLSFLKCYFALDVLALFWRVSKTKLKEVLWPFLDFMYKTLDLVILNALEFLYSNTIRLNGITGLTKNKLAIQCLRHV